MSAMSVSIVVVNFNGYDLTRACVSSVLQHAPGFEVIIVDNHSNDGSVEKLKAEFSSIKIIELPDNFGFGRANNIGTEQARGRYVFFLNNDTVLTEDVPSKLSSELERIADAGAIGPKLVNPDGSFQLSTGLDPSFLNEWRVRRMQKATRMSGHHDLSKLERRFSTRMEVDWLTGAALVVRKEVFQKVGGFDESFFMYFEDADLCRRIRNEGWRVVYDPSVRVTHLRGGSEHTPSMKIAVEYRKGQLRYYKKHCSLISQLFLRAYLLTRFASQWLTSVLVDKSRAAQASEVMRLAARPGD